MSTPLAETPTIGLGRFIKEARFSVPNHQRDYTWKEDYISTFIEDIRNAAHRNESMYFCGLMVFLKDDSQNYSILDGQQRLSTTLIVFSAIRNWLRNYSVYGDRATRIQERYLGDSDLDGDDIVPKLLLNTVNNEIFSTFVVGETPLTEVHNKLKTVKRGDRNKALLDAILYINQSIEGIAIEFNDTDEAKKYLLSVVEYMTENLQIVRLIVTGDEQAYTIFETLNDRGMVLAPLDLVKNYLFSQAEQKSTIVLRDLEIRWAEMTTILRDTKPDSFLRAFWTSRHGVPDGAKLFTPFKKEYKTPESAHKASLELRNVSEHYIALFDHHDPVWSKYSESSRSSIEAIGIIGGTQLYPVILAAIPIFESNEIEKLLKLLEVIIVRYQLVARGRPGRMESLGGKVAKAISKKQISTARQVLNELRELYISDESFEADFYGKYERESKKARYLLQKLEHQARLREQDKDPKDAPPSSNITIEHILPKSPNEKWKAQDWYDEELHKEHLYKLGNLCLLGDVNRSLGNKDYEEKSAVYKVSRILITRGVTRYTEWNFDNILKRQKWLAKLAVSTWKFE